MGKNLVLNFLDHNFRVACFNRTVEKMQEFIEANENRSVIGCSTLQDLVNNLTSPKKILLMISSSAIDDCLQQLFPLLHRGDIIIDGGNSLFSKTEQRCCKAEERGILFVGSGFSGGEEGARHGPSIMMGGNEKAWPHIRGMFEEIAAKANQKDPCCAWVGPGGAGHFVKTIHNGIEYGDMQIICEGYDLLKRGAHHSDEKIAQYFQKLSKQGELRSFLMECAAIVLQQKDADGTSLLSKILDIAGAKGTGKWSVESALEEGVPAPLIGEAVFARFFSTFKGMRKEMHQIFSSQNSEEKKCLDENSLLEFLPDGLYAAKIISYAQGYMIMYQASKNYRWNISFGDLSLIWRNGCIIRSVFLDNIRDAFVKDHNLKNLLHDSFFQEAISHSINGLRSVVTYAIDHHIPVPCLGSALSWFDSLISETLPANLLQGMRDFFGSHMYQRIDQPSGQFFHTQWHSTDEKQQ